MVQNPGKFVGKDGKKMKKILCVLLALATLLTSGLTTAALGVGQDHTSFDDLRDTRWAWAWPTIDAAIDYGFFVGYTPYRDGYGNLITDFGPADAVTEAVGLTLCARMVATRDERASVLAARLEQMRDVIPGTAENPDDPRAPYIWFRPEAATCLEFGIISEHDLIALRDGDRLGSSMSKADFAKYLIRATGLEDYAKTLQYNDLPFADASAIAQEYRPYVKLLSTYGVLTGDEAGNFNPNQGMNRAVCATMLVRTIQNVVNNDSLMEHAGQSATDSYVVYFDVNGGTAVYPSSMVVENGMRYGALPTPSRDGYVFDGWYTEAFGGYRVNASDTVELTRDQTVYAHWIFNPVPVETNEDHEPETSLTTEPVEPPTPKMFTVYFDPQGGTVSPAQKTLREDETYHTFPTPTRAGHTFDGWYTASSGGWKIEKIAKPAADTTLYAHWTEEPEICTTHTRGEYVLTSSYHPHNQYYRCTVCGNLYVGGTGTSDDCEECNPPAQTPDFIWPLKDGAGSVSSAAGVSRGGYVHVGTDIAAPAGTPILAVADGTVATAQYNSVRGNYVKIDHGDYYCTYQHMRSEATVKSGPVTQGQVIGYVGSTGESSGNHLHFEMVRTSSCPKGNKDLYTIVNILKKTPTYYAVTRGAKIGGYYELNLAQVGGSSNSGTTQTSKPETSFIDPGPVPVKTDGTYYSIKNKYTGKVLNVYYNRSANGTNVDIYDMDYTDSVYWKFAKSGSSYVLSPRNATGSALNVHSDTKGYNGCNVCIWSKTGHSTQNWVIEAVSGGYILRSASNTDLVLGATGNTNNSNVNLQTYQPGNNYQIWTFHEA